jgi:hypothetical protein
MVQDGVFDKKGKKISSGFQKPDLTAYEKFIGSLGGSAKAGTVASGGKGVVNSALSNGVYQGTIIVKDYAGVEKARIGQLSTTTWGISAYGGIIKGGSIEIGSGDSVFKADSYGLYLGDTVFADAPFSVDMDGNLKAHKGTIGGFTINPTKLYGGTIQTAEAVGAGASGVVMDTSGIRGYSSILGKVFDLPTDGSAPEFSSGVIKNTEFQLQTSSVIRTSDTVGDGTSSSAGVLVNNTGLYACTANQTLANANVKILATGEATFSGNVKGGMSDFMTGIGYFIGLNSGEYKMSIGNPAGNYINWDGSYLRIRGNLQLTSPLTNVSYATADLPIPPVETGLICSGGYE